MKKVFFSLFLAFFALKMSAQSESQTEYDFLRLPVSARAAAVGGDNISLVEDDASLTFSNPALLLSVTPKTIGLGYMNYMSGCNFGAASYNMVFKEKWNVSIGAEYMNYGSMKQTDAQNNDLGTFTASDLALSGTLAYELAKNLSGGITARWVYGMIGSYNSMAASVDLGLNWYEPESEWSVSAVAKNLGGQVKAYDETFEKIPTDFQIGATKRLLRSPLRLSATLVDLGHWDYKFINHLVVGMELLFSDQIYVAGGYNFRRASEMTVLDSDNKESSHMAGLSLGGGIMLDRFKLSVAYSKYHVSSSSLVVNVAFNL